MDGFLTKRDLADRFGVSKAYITYLLKKGTLPEPMRAGSHGIAIWNATDWEAIKTAYDGRNTTVGNPGRRKKVQG